jgi:hypothetical protein
MDREPTVRKEQACTSRGFSLRRIVALVILAHVGPQYGCATVQHQRTSDGWQAVIQLKPGVTLDIQDLGRQVRGTLVDVDQDRVRVQTEGGAIEDVRRANIRTIHVVSHSASDSLRNGFLVGAAIGIGYSLVVLSYLASGGDDQPDGGAWVAMPIIGGLIGGGSGALIDGARRRPRRTLLYRAERRSTRFGTCVGRLRSLP